ncbi:hypothetical protein L915_17022 [Phytophthora nicotianae]|uniref:Uncharacterized protein n=1 Tax=Phytophthora nicotianae TaxID=4792 RepID=W2G2T0_PHYNI|nr:hypothetical protein L915_17022 [Phytophthora nicotianae]
MAEEQVDDTLVVVTCSRWKCVATAVRLLMNRRRLEAASGVAPDSMAWGERRRPARGSLRREESVGGPESVPAAKEEKASRARR